MKDKNYNPIARQPVNKAKNSSKGYPLYPEDEDIYNKGQDDRDVDPDDISKTKAPTGGEEVLEIDETDDIKDESGNLDVPGSELDDEQEEVGSEDEENNYYSIGGDDHEDLEENKED